MATGTLAQQAAVGMTIVVSLIVTTALGRTLSLAEFGVWGLTLSFVGYITFIEGSVSTAAIREMSQATTDEARDRAFTLTLTTYTIAGLLSGTIVAVAGLLLLDVFKIPADLHGQARDGIVALAVIIAVGWPAKAFSDLLQATQHFKLYAGAQIVGSLAYLVTMVSLLLWVGPPLWVLIATTGLIAVAIALVSAAMVAAIRLRARVELRLLEPGHIRRFALFSGSMFAMSMTDIIIFQADRTVLAVFRSAATVGLYEAAVRPSTFVRQLQGTLAVTVFPTGARFIADRDDERLRQLLIRGTRYILAATAPLSVVFIVLSKPILEVWLGPRFVDAAPALSILVGTWLLGSATGIAGSLTIAAGRVRAMLGYSWGLALVNLALSLALTPAFGLEGVVIGTTAAYLLMTPVMVRIAVTTLPVTVGELVRQSWWPAYSLAGALAVVLVVVNSVVGLHGLAPVVATVAAALAVYAAAFWILHLDPGERLLLKQLLPLRSTRT